MKDIKEYLIKESVKDDILDAADSWFWDHTSEEDYDSRRDQISDLKDMAKGDNDRMVQHCIDDLYDEFNEKDVDRYSDAIADILKDCADSKLDRLSDDDDDSYYGDEDE